MTAICVPPSRPLEVRKADALAKVASATREWSSQPMLVGAFARDVWFWHLHGIDTERATEDLDISMEFPDWAGFQSFTEELCKLGFAQLIPGHPEKFIDPGTGQKLDLLPFGALSEDGRAIVWPTDHSHWSILGFEESYQTAAILTLTPELAIRCATLPAMILLKMVAFYERLEARKRKDGADIAFTLTQYVEAGNKVRLAEGADADVMDLAGGDILLAGTMLLGRDMGRMARPGTRSHVSEKLKMETGSGTRCPLAREVTRQATQGDFERARALLGGILAGIETVART
jgi:predicted nucleotidyltransferase